MPEPLFDSLFRATATLTMPPAQEIQSRSDRRVRRRVASAVVVSCVVVAMAVAGSFVWLGDRRTTMQVPTPSEVSTSSPDGRPTASASAPEPATGELSSSPPSTSPPAPQAGTLQSVLLRPADLGPGAWGSSTDMGGGDWGLAFMIQQCPAAKLGGHIAGVDGTEREFNDGAGRTAAQFVTKYRAGDSARAMSWVRGNVAACASFRATGTNIQFRMRIVSQGFAGDESFIVETTSTGSRRLYVFVRVNNLGTEIVQDPANDSFARQLGQRAATRMAPPR
jgi:hypothetical protein